MQCVSISRPKPTGATLAEARAIVDKKRLDGRKLTALKFWELVEDTADDKMKITDQGCLCIRDSGAARSEVLREVIRNVPPYAAVVERVMHGHEDTVTATDVAAHWYEHFRSEVSDSDKILNEQAICFFQVAQGADLGLLTIGRRGMPTRFEFDPDAARIFVEGPVNSFLRRSFCRGIDRRRIFGRSRCRRFQA